MPVFVHLTSHRNLPAIRRSGIRPGKGTSGIYALPVTRNFNVSHQWLRELRRSGGGSILGVYFRLPDEEIVKIGHYGSIALPMPAVEAAALMMAAEQRPAEAARAADAKSRAVRDRRRLPSSPEGFEVVIARKIGRAEILRIKPLPQVVGWRYAPGSHGKPPCACMCCERGRYGIRQLLRAVEADEAAGRAPKARLFGRDDRSLRRVEKLSAERRASSS